ncbi:influenza virus NS1A-binding protein-like protein A-like isoform X1 [Sesbania bispinosa]|nr:influenza virus NS1A-binding protein-like protein A-like isoform X1 [Sesbania bispinosa]
MEGATTDLHGGSLRRGSGHEWRWLGCADGTTTAEACDLAAVGCLMVVVFCGGGDDAHDSATGGELFGGGSRRWPRETVLRTAARPVGVVAGRWATVVGYGGRGARLKTMVTRAIIYGG